MVMLESSTTTTKSWPLPATDMVPAPVLTTSKQRTVPCLLNYHWAKCPSNKASLRRRKQPDRPSLTPGSTDLARGGRQG